MAELLADESVSKAKIAGRAHFHQPKSRFEGVKNPGRTVFGITTVHFIGLAPIRGEAGYSVNMLDLLDIRHFFARNWLSPLTFMRVSSV
jgi:hypothetical protein